MISICDFCKKEFTQKRERDPKKHCSVSCAQKNRKDKRKGTFEKGKAPWNKSLIGYGLGRKRSDESLIKYRKPKNKSEYKTNAHYRIRKTFEYKQWRKFIFDRDKSCIKCNSKTCLHAHHIVSLIDDISKALDVNNGILLCRSCHAKEHNFGQIKQFTGEKAELFINKP